MGSHGQQVGPPMAPFHEAHTGRIQEEHTPTIPPDDRAPRARRRGRGGREKKRIESFVPPDSGGPTGRPGRYKRVILSRFVLIVPPNYGLRHCRALCRSVTPSPRLLCPSRWRLEGSLFSRRIRECIRAVLPRYALCLCENAALDFSSCAHNDIKELVAGLEMSRIG